MGEQFELSQAKAMVEGSIDGIVSADHSGNIVFMNKSAEEMFGIRNADAIGKPLTVLMPEKYHALHRAGMRRFLETKIPKAIGHVVEMEGVRSDGKVFPVEMSLSYWQTEKGENFFTGIIRDISDRKIAESELARSRTEYEDLFNTIDIGIFKSTPGPSGTFIDGNPAVIRIFEADSKEDLLRHKPGELYRDPKERAAVSQKILSQKFVKDMELHLRTFKGRDIIVLSSVFLKKDDAGQEYFYGVFTDITDRHKDEVALRDKMDELEKMNSLMVDRELKMIELKAEIERLKSKAGK